VCVNAEMRVTGFLTCWCCCCSRGLCLQKLGLQEWIAKGDVETLKFIRSGGLDDIDKGDIEKITGDKPRRFGDFVKDSIKPMVNM
jgi:hypothetical protein